jgi:hypothetical protein
MYRQPCSSCSGNGSRSQHIHNRPNARRRPDSYDVQELLGRANLTGRYEEALVGNRCPGFGRFRFAGDEVVLEWPTENCRCLFRAVLIRWLHGDDIMHAMFLMVGTGRNVTQTTNQAS